MPDCPNCGAPMHINRDGGLFTCEHCGSQQAAPAVLDRFEVLGPDPSYCPSCATPLTLGRLEGYSLSCCMHCLGMLIPMGCFAAVIDAVRVHEGRRVSRALPRLQIPGERRIACPRCQQPMANHLYAGPGNVVIDTCERCGLNWLDPNELRQIVMAPDS